MYKIIQEASVQSPKVSIITPMYNVSEFIDQQIESLTDQTLLDIEIVLIDDGSTDDTLEKAMVKGKEYPEKLTIITKENGGASSARNIGLSVFKGDYLFFADADDVVPKDSLESLYQGAMLHQSDITTGRSMSFNSKNSWYIPGHYNSGLMRPGDKTIATNPELFYSLGPASKLFKREIIADLRMPQTIEIGEDQPFILEVLLRSQTIYTIDKIVYYYRSRETDEASLSQVVKTDPVRTFKSLVESLKIGLGLFDVYIENDLVRNRLLLAYFDRVVQSDLWPAVVESSKEKNVENQAYIFNQLTEIQSILPKFLFEENSFFFQMVLLELIERYTFIQDGAKKNYTKLLQETSLKVGPAVMANLVSNEEEVDTSLKLQAVKKAGKNNNSRPIFMYLFRRKLKRVFRQVMKKIPTLFRKFKTLVTSTILRKILFPLYKKQPNPELILFMTNKDDTLAGSFEPVYREIKRKNPNAKIKCYFKKSKRNFKEMNELLKDVAQAKLIFLDDYYKQIYGLKTAKTTEVVQLWHAAGAFKKFGFSAIGSLDSNTIQFEERAHQNYSKVICSSDEIRPFYAEAFNVPKENVLPLGISRTDKLFDEDYIQMIKQQFRQKHPEFRGRKIVTYAPTFRGGPKARQVFDNYFDMRRFRGNFSEEYVLIMKMHPSVKDGIIIYDDLVEDVFDMSEMDMNDLLLCTDVLITDYSSVIFDYSILKKPIIFYAYDLDEYMKERSFYYEYESFVPGPIVRSNDELFEVLKQIKEIDLEIIEEFSDRFFNNKGSSAKEIVNKIMN